jgi:hypothetical protein
MIDLFGEVLLICHSATCSNHFENLFAQKCFLSFSPKPNSNYINPRVRNILKISLSSTTRNRKPITIGDGIKGLNNINAMQEGSDLPKYLEVALSYKASRNKLDQYFGAPIKKP